MPTPKPVKAAPASLRDQALAALETKKEAQAAEEAANEKARAEAALTRVAKSQLKRFFPGVNWEFVGDMNDGTTLVKEKDGLDTVLGITPVYPEGEHPEGQGPSSWSVAIYKPLPFGEGQWINSWVINEAADLGAYIEQTEPKAEPAPEPAP